MMILLRRQIFMKVRKAVRIAAAWMICVLLAGCGEPFPTLTQEEYNLIVDYSAGVLSKYSTGNGEKLTRLMPKEEAPADAQEVPGGSTSPAPVVTPPAPEPSVPADQPEKQPEETQTPDTSEQQTPPSGGTDAGSEATDTPEPSGAGDDSATTPVSEEQQAVTIGRDDLLQKMQDGIQVDFNGYYVMNMYPDSSVGGAVLSAESGCKLLILSFSMKNTNSDAMNVDILHANPTFTLILNGEPVSRNLVTVLDNDMSTYSGTVGAGESAGAVLCFQVKEAQAKAIDTLNLKVNLRGEEQVLKIE